MSGPLGGDFFDLHCSNELHNVYSGLHVSIKHSETVKSLGTIVSVQVIHT